MNDEILTHGKSKTGSLQAGDCLPVQQAQDPEGKERETAPQFVTPSNLIGVDSELITPEMLTLVELNQQHIDTVVQTVPGGTKNVQDIYPLSPLQEGMLFHRLLNEKIDTYVLSTLFELQSRAHVGVLINALQKVIDRHDVLRSAVLWEKLPRPVQVVYRRAMLPVEEFVLDRDRDPIEQLRERMKPRHQGLNLRQAPLMWLRVAADPHGAQWYAVLQVHHLICDHQSLRVVVAEAMVCFEGREQAPPAPVAFRNYVAQALANARTQEMEAFFRSKLGDVDEPTAPFWLFDVHGDGSQIEEDCQVLDTDLAKEVRIQARRLGVSAARLFHAAWAVVVARTSGRDEVVYGTVLLTARQRSARAQRMLGLSVNTLPLRLRLQDATAKELVEQTHRELVELLNHEAAPLTLAQRCSGITGTAPLFTSLLNYRRSVPEPEAEPASAAGVRVLARGEAWTNYPVTLTVDDLGDGFVLMAKADRRVGPHRIMSYLHTGLQSLVKALEQAPQTSALALSILPEPERRQVIELFNATRAPYPQEKLIHELFEEQVGRTPEAVAVVYEGQSLTYAELNCKANQLAQYLRDKGVGPDQLVGICVERSLEMVVGLLGILKAGGAYVPLDPDYPIERLASMLEDATPSVLLIQARLRGRLPDTAAEVIALDNDWNEIAERATSNLDSRAIGLHSCHLAYVIYTSGSTGEPKGVMIENRNVLSLWQGLQHVYCQSSSCQRIAVNASFNFDASVKQFVQLLSGRTIVLVPQECRWDASMLLDFIDEHRIDGIDCTPWQLKSWLSAGLLEKTDRHRLRMALVGGEPIDAELWSSLAQSSEMDFYNVYGPTESTVDTTFAHLKWDTTAPHIGRPMENRRVYILDRYGQPLPIGVAGEMYIGGAGVARGYLNRPELTAERFLLDPFSADPQARMYKTGDIGQWRLDGTIEYLGRNDHQVKIRGFRIELGEIEAQLAQYAQVKEAVVIVREDVLGEKRLVAYVTQRDQSGLSVEELRAHLKGMLPDYMVPSAFVVLESLPLTPNGKLDRRALPAPEPRAFMRQQYDAPRGEIEEVLSAIWQQLLRVERVGRQDNFFEFGGHSLLAIRVITEIGHVLDIDLPLRTLFENPTIEALSERIAQEIAAEVSMEMP